MEVMNILRLQEVKDVIFRARWGVLERYIKMARAFDVGGFHRRSTKSAIQPTSSEILQAPPNNIDQDIHQHASFHPDTTDFPPPPDSRKSSPRAPRRPSLHAIDSVLLGF
jgi:hypothetical protein